MIQPELFARLRLLAEAYRLPVTGPAERVNQIAPPSAVQQVLAEVESRLPDGRFRVLAAGQRFDVLLPTNTQPGERVRVSIAAARSDAPASAPAATAHAEESVHSQLSAAGRFVAELALGGGRAPPGAARAPGAIPPSQPLLPDAPVSPAVAAATLRELVALSGLFYESHQAEWVGGERTREQLLREPQGRLPPLPAALPRAGAQAASAPPAAAAPSTAEAAPDFEAPPALHPAAAPLVQQQLNALEARHIVWSGQIWPGQPMRWEIEETQDEAPRAPGAPAARAWQTRVDLQLPQLGRVSALLTLGARGLQLRLAAELEPTRALLAAQSAELGAALAGAGLPPAFIGTGDRVQPG